MRNGSVCHLAIDAGGVEALVAGRELYHVAVRVRKLERPAWQAIKAACAGQIGSVLELLQGRLSDHVMEVVTERDTGLFPKPGQMELACDCPDWATMCKHVAALLYGVGSRLDDSPELLFRLRGVDEAELIAADLTLPSGAASTDTLADGDLGSIFGSVLDAEDDPPAARAAPPDVALPPPPALTGAQVAELRAWCGFSVPEFARLLRVADATVRRWEDAPGPLTLRARTREALTVLRREAGDQDA